MFGKSATTGSLPGLGSLASTVQKLTRRGGGATLGLDISASSAKLVELSQRPDGGFQLEHFASEPFGKGWIHEGQIEKFDEVAEAVRRLVGRSGTRAREAVMAIPTQAVITKKVGLPVGLSDDELAVQVEAEADQFVPFPLDEVALDYVVLGPSAQLGEIDVFIAAARKDRIEDRQGLAEAAGLKAVVMEVESNASHLALRHLMKDLPGRGQDAMVALFEIGSEATSLKVMHRDEIVYDRDQSFGGERLTEQIAREYNLTVDEAEKKKLSGDLPDSYQAVVLPSFVDSLAQEIARSLQYFFTSTPYHRVDYLMLAGGSAALPGLRDRVTDLAGFATRVVDPFDQMTFGPGVREGRLQRESPAYLMACGLAMRRFAA